MPSPSAPDPAFHPTRWSLVWLARGEGKAAARALNELCALYHYPLYCFARRRGLSPEDAADATQDLFADLIAKDRFAEADEAKGRLRSFLLQAFVWHLDRRWEKAHRECHDKRLTVSLDEELAREDRYLREPATNQTPETIYHRSWAMQLLATSLATVEKAWADTGRAEAFTILKPFLGGAWKSGENYTAAAAALGITVNAAHQRVSLLRRDFRERLLAEIRETIATDDPAAIEEELHFLYRALGDQM